VIPDTKFRFERSREAEGVSAWVADAAAVLDPPTAAFCHRLKMLLVDLGHQLSTLEAPPQFRDKK
jgi:hypothetical protein